MLSIFSLIHFVDFKNLNAKLKYGRVMQYSGVILHRYRYQPFEYSNALDVAYGNMKFLQ